MSSEPDTNGPAALQFDAELLRRYDVAGPRYTSYPTAPHFHADFHSGRLRRHIEQTNRDPAGRALSLYVHVPFCRSPCFYCGCNRIITRDQSVAEPYVERLLAEANLIAPWIARQREVVQLHLGGGTPNFLEPALLARLVEGLAGRFKLSTSSARDFSIELDPRWASPAQIHLLAELGFNRASLGVQDFDRQVQHAINRTQSVEETLALIDICRESGLSSVNVDLIYGLPNQTRAGFERTLRTILGARPERLAIYGYAHLPQLFKAQRQIPEAALPDPAARLALLGLAIEKLTGAGYQYIGMDHFAVPEDALSRAQRAYRLHRNFMGYTTHADCDLIGLGVSAISHVGASFSQNARDLPGWEQALEAGRLPLARGLELDRDDLIRAEVIQQLMCQAEVRILSLEQRFKIDFAQYFASALERLGPLASDGLVLLGPERIAATARGRLLLRNIAMCFDRYLQSMPQPSERPRFSRAL